MSRPVLVKSVLWGGARAGATLATFNETAEVLPARNDGGLHLREHAVKSRKKSVTVEFVHTDTLAALEALVGTSETLTVQLKDGESAGADIQATTPGTCKALLESVELSSDGSGSATWHIWSSDGTTNPIAWS